MKTPSRRILHRIAGECRHTRLPRPNPGRRRSRRIPARAGAPLLTAYDDCWAAFRWIESHTAKTKPDPWINEYVDTAQVFLMGESAGANLAHYVAVRAGVNKTGLGIRGLIAVHPYFSRKKPDKIMKYLYRSSSGSDDDAKLNPGSDPDPDLDKMGCSNVLVVVAEKDFFRPRGVDYVETLKKSEWGGKVEFMENEGEDHCFYLFNPSSEKAKEKGLNRHRLCIDYFLVKLRSSETKPSHKMLVHGLMGYPTTSSYVFCQHAMAIVVI
ncbi:hypothetical protein OSB04_015865 [Centaurea solstitialis]|uniref:Alpha/beta hydrolase fold-3 domain-containing protein n=1 Tax=Centaurea solstitialis TaxID=347529 RepID=A0AA38SZU4_9ASTR|nr:hypothetical protein OSB04_015865 [Centaurea solstitialis]